MQHGSNVTFVIFFVLVSVVLGDEMRREREIWKKRKFLVQFSKGERVSVTSLFLKERVSNFSFLAWPRSSTGDSVSVTVLFLSSRVSYFSASSSAFFPFEAEVPFSSFLS